MAIPPQPPRLTRADGSPIRVLAVDDEPSLTELLSMAMRYEGWDVTTADSGVHAVREAKATRPDVIVLDMMLPDFDGLEVMRRIRMDQPNVPVIFLTAKDAVGDRIAGLTASGDDYVTKPFSLDEVIARIRAILRRSRSVQEEDDAVLRVDALTLNVDTHEVFLGDEEIDLSPTEFNLLHYLMLNANRVLSKAQILDHVWEYDFNGDSSIVESYISYLRRKIDNNRENHEPLIHTKRGVGYMIRGSRG